MEDLVLSMQGSPLLIEVSLYSAVWVGNMVDLLIGMNNVSSSKSVKWLWGISG